MPASSEESLGGFLSFLKSGHFADFTIKCKGYTWKVHKVIISAECGFFRKMCQSSFKVRDFDLKCGVTAATIPE